MTVVEVAGMSVSYVVRGAGPPIVLLHGWPLDHREFIRQLDGLSDVHQVIAWDAPGAGGSNDPPDGASLHDWADWLAAFLDEIGHDRAHIAGLSWGGGLALALAQRHPDRVRSLILMSAYAGWGGSLPADEVQRRLALTIENTEKNPEEWIPGMLQTLLPDGAAPGLAHELTTMLSDFHPEATRAALRAFAEADLRPLLPTIETPTLMLYGELDVRSPRAVWEPIHQAISGSRLVVIPDVGHMVDMQAPDRCNQEIAAFIREVETPA